MASPRTSQSSHFAVSRSPAQPKNELVVARLSTLETMGLAEAAGLGQWLVRQDFETALRAMQALGTGKRSWPLTACRYRTPGFRWPCSTSATARHLEGRILAHAEDEGTARQHPGQGSPPAENTQPPANSERLRNRESSLAFAQEPSILRSSCSRSPL